MPDHIRQEPKVLVSTENLNEQEWLAYRRQGIGGSDVAAILGISPFRTARDLYDDKLNIASAVDDTGNWVALEMGHLLEPLVAQIFTKKTGLEVFQIKKMFQHPQYPFMLADVDYFVRLPNGEIALLEIKTTNYNAKDHWWKDGEEYVPVYYETQGRHYIGIKPEQNARATPQEIHQTYSLLLSMLPLTPTHKAHLLSPRRGLTEYQIARFGLKSTPPAFLCRGYAERLRRQGCTLQGVPGFYQDDAGRWTINFGSRTAGILLPAVGLDGLICGMQIRLDTPLRRRDDPPGKSGAKYIWLSSIGKPHGVTSGSPLHFVGEPFAKTVYVTEGLLKADIAHCLTGRSFIAVAGVNSLNGLESALRCMAQNGTKLVVEAYDMDKLENEYVASAAEKVQQIAHAAGLQSTSIVWNTACKGIDDWQLALRQEETKEKAA